MARTTRAAGAALRRIIFFPFRILLRAAMVCMTALLLGVGGGVGGLGVGMRKVDKPEQENPVVCVEEGQDERT
jgi:hypothetical protein